MPLVRTGIPIGVEEDRRWKRKTVTFSPGDKLVLYTDGVTEAQNEQGDFFEDDMLIEAALENSECNAFELQTNILSKVENFVGENPQSDDITLMVLYKNRQETSK
jgi:sigma-B regulation protein RsbU (phosphoserine phosphatase)